MARAIVAEAQHRTYSHPETLAVLTLAIEEDWPDASSLAGLCDRIDAVRAGSGSSIDPWFNLYRALGYTGDVQARWEFKARLYAHIHQAAALYTRLADDGKDDPFMALTDAEAKQLVADVAQLRKDMAKVLDHTTDTRIQLRGPNDAGWPQLGQNAQRQNLSFIDALAAVKKKLLGA